MEVLAVVLLAVRDDRFRLAELVQHDDQLAALDLLHLAGEQLADLAGELVADPGALALADALDDALLGRLHRRAGRTPSNGHVLLEHVADLEVRVLVAGLLQRDLPGRVLDRLDHLAEPDDANGPLQLVDAQLELDVRAVAADQGGLDAVAQQVEQFRAIELLGGGELAEGGKDFG